jgi:hypothetical protein
VPCRPAMADPRGYKGGKRGYQWTSEDYNMKHGDYTSGYDGDVNYEDERYASWLLWSVKQHSAKTFISPACRE